MTKPDPVIAKVDQRAARKLKARKRPESNTWFGLGMIGIIGWAIVVPTLLGAALGSWLDKNHPGGHSWTLALLVAGLVLGCFNAWNWVSQQETKMLSEEKEDDD